MGGCEDPSAPQERELELSLEEELLEVSCCIDEYLAAKWSKPKLDNFQNQGQFRKFRKGLKTINSHSRLCVQVRRAPQRRGTPRPNQSKPHIVRAVGDITEDELQLVAEHMTDKVYNRVTVSYYVVSITSYYRLSVFVG